MKVKVTDVQSLWVGDSLSPMEISCINSFICFGHNFHLYVYDEVKNVPSGTILHDAAEIMPASSVWKYKLTGGLGGFSDHFRYHLLLSNDIPWVDTDFICIKPLEVDSKFCIASERMRLKKHNHITGSFLSAGDLGRNIIEEARDMTDGADDRDHKIHGFYGPILLSFLVNKKPKLKKFVASPDVFCPVNWWEYQSLINPSGIEIPESTLAVHMWNECWRRDNVDKYKKASKGSFYRKITDMYS